MDTTYIKYNGDSWRFCMQNILAQAVKDSPLPCITETITDQLPPCTLTDRDKKMLGQVAKGRESSSKVT